MSFLPPHMPGDLERTLWHIATFSEHSGKIVTLGDLGELFPDFEIVVVDKNSHATIYGVRLPLQKIAYHCDEGCGQLIIGPPEIKDDLSIYEGHPLAGREGYDVYCTECGHPLASFTGRVS